MLCVVSGFDHTCFNVSLFVIAVTARTTTVHDNKQGRHRMIKGGFMPVDWKGVMATALTAGTALVAYAKLKGLDWPLLGSYRTASVVILVLGLGACIAASWNGTPLKDNWTMLASVLGVFAFGLGLINLLANNQIIFVALAVDIIALWVITTIHHLITKGS